MSNALCFPCQPGSGPRRWVIRACGCPCPFYIVDEPGNAVYPELNTDPGFDWTQWPVWAIEPATYDGFDVCVQVIRPAIKSDTYPPFPEAFTFVERVESCADEACELQYACEAPMPGSSTECLPIGIAAPGVCWDSAVSALRRMTVTGRYDQVTSGSFTDGDVWDTTWWTQWHVSIETVHDPIDNHVLHTQCTDFACVHGAINHSIRGGDPEDFEGEISFKGCSEFGNLLTGIRDDGWFLTPDDPWFWDDGLYLHGNAGEWQWMSPDPDSGGHPDVNGRVCQNGVPACDTWGDASNGGTRCVRYTGWGNHDERFDEHSAGPLGSWTSWYRRRQTVTFDGCCAPLSLAMTTTESGLAVPDRRVVGVGARRPPAGTTNEDQWGGRGCCGR